MNEKLQYASMLEIPVSTCNVTYKPTKKRRFGRKKSAATEDVKKELLKKVNAISEVESVPSAPEKTAAEEVAETLTENVASMDERGEVAVMVQGLAQMEIGCHTDVMDGCPKAIAIPMLLRAADPQIIAVDEITQAEDVQAMEEAAHCGVRFVATLHADSAADLQKRPLLRKLHRTRIFEKAICIRITDRHRRYRIEDL